MPVSRKVVVGGEVDDGVDLTRAANLGERRGELPRVRDVGRKPGNVRSRGGTAFVRGTSVQSDHPALRVERIEQVTAEKPGGSGHDDAAGARTRLH
jgi:hypothetical protein